ASAGTRRGWMALQAPQRRGARVAGRSRTADRPRHGDEPAARAARGRPAFPPRFRLGERWCSRRGGDRAAASLSERRQAKFRALREEARGISEEHVVDEGFAVAASTHLERGLWDRERIADAPVAGGVEPDAFPTADLEHVGRAWRRRLGIWIQRDAGPESAVEHAPDRVFLDVVDDHAAGLDTGVRGEHVEDEVGALELVLEVRRVDENQLAVLHREVDVGLEHSHFIARIPVQPNLTDAENVRSVEKLGNHLEHGACESEVLGLLRIEAEPAIMRQAEFRGACRFVRSQLPVVVTEAVNRPAVEPGPEGGFTDCHATRRDHGEVIVRRPAHHVAVRFDVAHRWNQCVRPAPALTAALPAETGSGSVDGSLNNSRSRGARSGWPSESSAAASRSATQRKSSATPWRSTRSRNAATSSSFARTGMNPCTMIADDEGLGGLEGRGARDGMFARVDVRWRARKQTRKRAWKEVARSRRG